VTSLSQHSPKNKTTRQLDLFADDAPPEHATQIGNGFRFGEATRKIPHVQRETAE
jgi:hypothetical protein